MSQKEREELNMDKTEKDCSGCFYYGRPSDAPETTPDECMYIPAEDEGYIPPCEWCRSVKQNLL